MAANLRCTKCGLLLDVPEGVKEPWLTCARCHERLVNPDALRVDGQPRVTLLGALGTLLLLGGGLGIVLGWGAILLHEVGRRSGTGLTVGERMVLNLLICGCAIVGGLMLIRASERPASRRLLVGAALAAVIAALILLGVSGL